MSRFEFVSVAVALFYAMALGRLVNGIAPSLRRDARFPVQVAWIFVLLLTGTLQWWMMWVTASSSWTAPRFLFVLSLPAVLLARTQILLGEDPVEVGSFRDRFFARRVPFFALAIVAAVQGALAPWIFGSIPWFQPGEIHRLTAIFVTLGVAGLVCKSERAHTILVTAYAFAVAAAFALAPGV